MTDKPMRIMNNNFMERGFTYSSQLTAFPAANVYNQSRSKTWKASGNFEVTSSNNKIYINDGTNKTITLTIAAYATPVLLAAHVQTQLNASSSGWTCTYSSSNFKFTIANSGSVFLQFNLTTAAAWDMLGYTGTASTSGTSFVADEQRNHTSEWVQCDLGVPQLATFVGAISGIDEVFSLSQTATVKLRANNIDYWVSPPVDITVTIDDSGCLKFLDDDVTATYRYWRLEITDRLNYSGPSGIKLSYVYIGDHTTMTLSNISGGIEKELVDPSNVQQSENGALFFEVRPRYLAIKSCQIQLLSGSEQREIEQLFYDLGKRTPFFVSLDPGLAVSSSLGELTRFVVMGSSPQLRHIIRDYYSFSFDMREAF